MYISCDEIQQSCVLYTVIFETLQFDSCSPSTSPRMVGCAGMTSYSASMASRCWAAPTRRLWTRSVTAAPLAADSSLSHSHRPPAHTTSQELNHVLRHFASNVRLLPVCKYRGERPGRSMNNVWDHVIYCHYLPSVCMTRPRWRK